MFYNVLVCFVLITLQSSANAAPMNSNNSESTTANVIAIEPESTSSSAPLFEITSRKKAANDIVELPKRVEESDEEESSEIYELKLKPTKKNNNKKAPVNNKKNNKNKNDDSEDLFPDFTQGYKKVYKKIQYWWRDLESSFAVTPVSYEGPSKKVKKDSSSIALENKSQNKGTTKKPTKKPPPTKKKKAPPPPKKKDQKQREPEGWFDWNKIILVLGGIVTVLDLFGIR